MSGEYASIILPDASGNRFFTILHHHKGPHPWRFVGGKIDAGELPIAAAARELREELGIEAHDLRLIEKFEHPEDGNQWTGYYFLCSRYSGEVTVQEPHKHSAPCWLTGEELKEKNAHPEYEAVLKLQPFRSL